MAKIIKVKKMKKVKSSAIVSISRFPRPFPVKTAQLLKNEIVRIVENLEFRRTLLFEVWSKWRTRKPFISAMSSGFFELPLKELQPLTLETINALNAFYRKLDDVKFYIEYTEDMPTTMQMRFDRHFELLKALSEKAVHCLDVELERKDDVVGGSM